MSDLPVFGDWLDPGDPRFWDPAEHFPRHWVITTKSGALQPLNLWSHQFLMSAMLMRAYREQKYLAVVKPRQLGSSTFWMGVAMQHVLWREGCRARVVAQRAKVAQELANTAKRMYRYCGSPWRPAETKGLKRSIEILGNNSQLDIGSVGQDDPGRGDTLQFLVATEICKWKRADNQWSSLLSACSRLDGAMVIAESTPLYHGDPLHQLFDHSQDPDSEWLSLFIPWTASEQYAAQPPVGWNPNPDVTDYANKHHLTDAQTYWMATEGLQKTKGRMDLFRAEYPIDVVDCWLPGGDATFNVDRLTARMKELDGGTGLLANTESYVEWEEPDPKKRYLIACDPAGSFSERDKWGFQVINTTDCSQAAEFEGHSNAFMMARMMADIGKKFSNATIYVEANGIGEGVMVQLISMGYPYIYFRPEGGKPGVHANAGLKAQAISILQQLIADGSLRINSHRLLAQLLNYRNQWDGFGESRGRNRDAGGGHFDLVASMAIAAWAWRTEGGGVVVHKEKTLADHRRVFKDYLAALDRISAQGGGDEETPWGRHI